MKPHISKCNGEIYAEIIQYTIKKGPAQLDTGPVYYPVTKYPPLCQCYSQQGTIAPT